jgi:hypothetical protein
VNRNLQGVVDGPKRVTEPRIENQRVNPLPKVSDGLKDADGLSTAGLMIRANAREFSLFDDEFRVPTEAIFVLDENMRDLKNFALSVDFIYNVP